MPFRRRSRIGKTTQQIQRLLGGTSRLTSKGVADLLDSPVQEVQRTDSNVKYFPVESASPYVVPLQELIAGTNIVGIRTAGPMTVHIPLRAQEEQVITIADERGTADVDPITIQVA